jgi:membrane protein YdbS with pleckstrin-like domain
MSGASMTNKVMPDGIRAWLVASTVVLVVSLVLLTGNIVAGFCFFADMKVPLWVSGLGAVAVLGVVIGFGGVFLLLVVGGVKGWREGHRRVK